MHKPFLSPCLLRLLLLPAPRFLPSLDPLTLFPQQRRQMKSKDKYKKAPKTLFQSKSTEDKRWITQMNTQRYNGALKDAFLPFCSLFHCVTRSRAPFEWPSALIHYALHFPFACINKQINNAGPSQANNTRHLRSFVVFIHASTKASSEQCSGACLVFLRRHVRRVNQVR